RLWNPAAPTPIPYTTLFRSDVAGRPAGTPQRVVLGIRATRWGLRRIGPLQLAAVGDWGSYRFGPVTEDALVLRTLPLPTAFDSQDRKSTRLNSSHVKSSYAV